MALSGSLRGQLKGHIRKAVHIFLANFYELQVSALDLVVCRVALPVLLDRAILQHVKGANGLVRPEIAGTGFGFGQRIRPVR